MLATDASGKVLSVAGVAHSESRTASALSMMLAPPLAEMTIKNFAGLCSPSFRAPVFHFCSSVITCSRQPERKGDNPAAPPAAQTESACIISRLLSLPLFFRAMIGFSVEDRLSRGDDGEARQRHPRLPR